MHASFREIGYGNGMAKEKRAGILIWHEYGKPYQVWQYGKGMAWNGWQGFSSI
jgi:hypothetical protein